MRKIASFLGALSFLAIDAHAQSSTLPQRVTCQQQARDGSPLWHAQEIELKHFGLGYGSVTWIPDGFDYSLEGKPIITWAAKTEETGASMRFVTVSGEHSYLVSTTLSAEYRGFYEGYDEKHPNVLLFCK